MNEEKRIAGTPSLAFAVVNQLYSPEIANVLFPACTPDEAYRNYILYRGPLKRDLFDRLAMTVNSTLPKLPSDDWIWCVVPHVLGVIEGPNKPDVQVAASSVFVLYPLDFDDRDGVELTVTGAKEAMYRWSSNKKWADEINRYGSQMTFGECAVIGGDNFTLRFVGEGKYAFFDLRKRQTNPPYNWL